jgi:putative addiction module killer protein
MSKTILIYRAVSGHEPFFDWLYSLRDKTIRDRIQARISRIGEGNFGDHKRFYGILELRLHFGKGYRLYCGEDGDTIIILLNGGDKSTQEKDIDSALKYWEDYNEQKKI